MKIYSKCLAIGLIILFFGVSFGVSVEPLSCDAYGPYEGNIMEDIEFDGTATGGIPPFEFFWDYGDGNTSSGDPHPTHNYANAGNYTVILTVTDSEDNTASDTTYTYINAPPNTPIIDGQTNGKVGQEYEYTFSSTDPDGDDISYLINWGDGTGEIDVGIYYPSGEEQTAKHTWTEEDAYIVRVKAKDVLDADSEWGELEVSMPKTHTYNPMLQLLYRIAECYYFLQKNIKPNNTIIIL